MGMYRKKPVTVEANQWFKNGDHPDDYVERHDGNRSPEYRRAENWEGEVVRYYRHPQVLGTTPCEQCGKPHHDHGWIDTLEQGHRVCPGDWIITGVKGERYPCKPDIFEATYEPVAQAQQTTEPEAWNQAQVCTWIGNQLTTHPSMFERSEVCKFVRGLGRNAVLRSMFPKPQAQQQTTVEEPELPVSVAHISDPDSSDAYDSIPVYTAAQMHEHYAAGVRAGMGQSQWQPIETAPKDGRSFDVWVKSTKNPDYGVRMTGVYYVQGVLCGSKFPNSSWCEYASHWMPLPEPPAMQGDNHE